ncbi:putative lipid II flippase FtsW [Desertimonas flava]|uniref:putative lipid II flippase FtsW n=1 Tax=Desertimonas flava TaxID=2064846 RepID=UPI000E3414C0|nr:putative lipid II flippase FtsW [Desertimonas flava]
MTATQQPRAGRAGLDDGAYPVRSRRPHRPSPGRSRRQADRPATSFREVVEQATALPEHPADDLRPAIDRAIPMTERRRLALERLNVAAKPKAKHRVSQRGAAVAEKPRFWDVQHGPAPIGYYVLVVVVTVFVMLGLVMVLSASAQTEVQKGNSPYAIFNRQLLWAGLGTIGLFVTMRVSLPWVRRLATIGLVLAGGGMLLPFVPGVGITINDARAWIDLGSFTMQPSEFLKLAVVIYAADLLVRRQNDLADVRRSLRPLLLLAGFAAGACLMQSDLGSAIVMTSIVLAVAFIGGVPLVPMIASGVMAAGGAIVFVVSSPRRLDRFTAFLDIAGNRDELSYQVNQGMLAIANGGLSGSGVGGGNGKLGYLPLAHSDFIFAVIADELGFVGSVAVVGGFGVLVWFGIKAALSSPDRFGMLVAGGISAWFGVQAIVNMGGVVGLMPVTGLTLPFFSAGGSSLFISMTAAGLLLNVARRGHVPASEERRSIAPAGTRTVRRARLATPRS